MIASVFIGVNVIRRMLGGEMVAVFQIAKSFQFGASESNRIGVSSIRGIDPPHHFDNTVNDVARLDHNRGNARGLSKETVVLPRRYRISDDTLHEVELDLQITVECVLDREIGQHELLCDFECDNSTSAFRQLLAFFVQNFP